MENFRPSTDFSVNANYQNFVSNATSQTTMGDHNRLVNVNARCKLTGSGAHVPASLNGSKMDKMTDNEESVTQRLEASLRFVKLLFDFVCLIPANSSQSKKLVKLVFEF